MAVGSTANSASLSPSRISSFSSVLRPSLRMLFLGSFSGGGPLSLEMAYFRL